jgi:hypothetical protein
MTASAANDGDDSSRVVEGINLDKLNRMLKSVDYASVKNKKAVYSRLYHEANATHYSGRGISFTDMLLLLAHHKLIVDREALVYVCISVLSLVLLSDGIISQIEGPRCSDSNQQARHRPC